MEMKAAEFIRKVRKYARKNGVAFEYDAGHGKGSHGRITLGDKFTTIIGEDKTIRPGLLRAMSKDLGITLDDL